MGTRRIHEGWTTVAVAPLAVGWRNVYRLDDGTLITQPCPAVLVEENRCDYISYDEPGPDGTTRVAERVRAHEPPYDTRAVYADADCGWLQAACDLGNYVGTIGPGDDPGVLLVDGS